MDPKFKDKVRANIKRVIGWFFVVLFGMAILGFFISLKDDGYESSELPVIALCCSFFALGVYLIINANLRLKLIHNSKSYSNVISAGQNTFSDIALAVGDSEENVAKKIVIMIKRGYINDVYLDASKRTVVFKNVPEKAFVGVRCENCNGITKIQVGTVGNCEFCGSYISSK